MQKTMQPDEMVEAIEVLASPAVQFRTYKVSKVRFRYLGGVCRAHHGRWARSRRRCFGGMAAMPQRASHTEAALAGKPWTETTLRAARAALATDYTPITDVRATAAYRQVAQNLLERFILRRGPTIPCRRPVSAFSLRGRRSHAQASAKSRCRDRRAYTASA